jgi:uncharacterized protein YxjI
MTTTAMQPQQHADRFKHDTYVVRRQVFKLMGAAFHIYDPAGNLVLYSKQKAFKLKEDIRLYSDDSMRVELLSIAARQIIDFSAAYDVVDPQARQKVGALKRKGWSSMLRDEWILMDANDRELGTIKEDSMIAALVRRFVDIAALVFPQKFHAEIGGGLVCTFQQNYNPFVRKLTVDFTHDTNCRLDRRLGLAAAVLLSAIEGKQG